MSVYSINGVHHTVGTNPNTKKKNYDINTILSLLNTLLDRGAKNNQTQLCNSITTLLNDCLSQMDSIDAIVE
eukprot:UN00651